MNGEVNLHRLGIDEIEKQANRTLVILWLIIWPSIGIGVLLGLDAWHGFVWGFIASGLLSSIIVWILYALPAARGKKQIIMSWSGTTLKIAKSGSRKDFVLKTDAPHKITLIRAKLENRVLLRFEQLDGANKTLHLFDVMGPLPFVLPMKVTGDARTLLGFEPKFGGMQILKIARFAMTMEGGDADSQMTFLLEFLEQNLEQRVWRYEYLFKGGSTLLLEDGFHLRHDDLDVHYPLEKMFNIEFLAEEIISDSGARTVAKVHVAFIGEAGPKDALVFSVTAPKDVLDHFPSSWGIPDEALSRSVTLYDDSPDSFVAARALRRYLERQAPSHPVLEILRF